MKGLIFILCVIQLNQVWAQKKLLGSYRWNVDYIAQSDVRYVFFEDGTFLYEAWDDIGDYFGIGYFELNDDSICFHYQFIPEQSRSFKIIKENTTDSLSSIMAINSLNREEKMAVAYEVIENGKPILREKSDALGKAFFKLEEERKLKVIVYAQNSKSILAEPTMFEIPYVKESISYVVLTPGLRHNTSFVSVKNENYAIKIYRKGNAFAIWKNGSWQVFERQKN